MDEVGSVPGVGLTALEALSVLHSFIMGEIRNYRVFLPPDYYISEKRYPVLYWFHGSGGSSIQDTYRADFEAYLDPIENQYCLPRMILP